MCKLMNNYCVHNLYEKVWLTLIVHPSMTSIKFIEKYQNLAIYIILTFTLPTEEILCMKNWGH